MRKTLSALMLAVSLGLSLPTFASEPSLHEVYQAANSGRMDEAQRMMKEVLAAHPNSGKAHYVEAELLAKQGRASQAAQELAMAEKLAPGLPFATAESVASLKTSVAPRSLASPVVGNAQPIRGESGFPLGMWLAGLGLIALVIWAAKRLSQREQPLGATSATSGGGGYHPAYSGNNYPGNAYGGVPPGYGGPGAAPAAAGGMGSQILGGLAAGAAVGAGVVAGEALMHRVLDGNHSAPATAPLSSGFSDIPDLPSTPPLEAMGGDDFGIADSASWDDGGSGDNDWS